VGSANVEGVIVPMQPAAAIRGKVTLDGRDAGGSVQVALAGENNVGYAASMPAEVSADGSMTLVFNALPDVRYRFLITGGQGLRGRGGPPQDIYPADAVLGGRSVFDSGFVAGRETGGAFEVILKRGAATVNGVVYRPGQKAAIGATVALVPPAERRDNLNLYASAITDANGHFELRAAPGEYKLFAWDYLSPGAFQNPAILASVEDRGRSITVQPSAGHTVNLDLIER
jgi:hypothetical protein